MPARPRRFVGVAPADVDAVRWLGEGDPDGADVAALTGWGVEWKSVACRCISRPEHPSPHFLAVWDETTKEWQHVRPGSWIVRRLDGTFTAVGATEFRGAYRLADTDPRES